MRLSAENVIKRCLLNAPFPDFVYKIIACPEFDSPKISMMESEFAVCDEQGRKMTVNSHLEPQSQTDEQR